MIPNKEILEAALDDSFLKKLSLVARCYGWLGDYTEVKDFVVWCHDHAGVRCPELEPFALEENEE